MVPRPGHIYVFSSIVVSISLMTASSVIARDPSLSALTVVSYSDNYIPASDPEITWDEVSIRSLRTTYEVTNQSWAYCDLDWGLEVGVRIAADNGIVYDAFYSHYKDSESARGTSGCDSYQDDSYSDMDDAKRVLGPNSGRIDNWIIRTEYANEYASILAAINSQIASRQGGLPLPQWQTWTRDASWSLAGLTGSFAPTDRITIETPAGVVVKGVAP